MIKNILVTGAGGYIGSVLVPTLLKKGFKVVAIDRFFFGNYLKPNKNLKIVYEDIRKINSKNFRNIDAVIDLAAISNDPSGEKFKQQTYDINFKARVNNAKLAKKNNVKRYILPSSCSNYGRIKDSQIADETFKLNPLTHYSKANSLAEKEILKLSSDKFCSTIIRQGTVFGYSPRLRLDLAINGMTYGIYKNRVLPVMRDGSQRRPMLHIKDAVRAMIFLLNADNSIINNQIYNIGDRETNYSINDLVLIFKKIYKSQFSTEWYGSADKRSYFVSFNKINNLKFYTKFRAEDGIYELDKIFHKNQYILSDKNITLNWYSLLEDWKIILDKVSINGKILK
jgi:nucleoside-diphosphate-sugar epimerase